MIRALFTALSVCVLVSGCGTVGPMTGNFDESSGAPRTETRLRSGDQIVVRLDTGGVSQPNSYEVGIDENGEISLPLVGKIKAAGTTPAELGELIQAAYVPRFFVRCTATVLTARRYFYVGGEVRAQGRYDWTEDMTLLKAINTAGGFTDFANRKKVDLTRGNEKRTLNCEEIRQHPDQDVPIQPGDSIYVPRSLF